MPIDPMEVTERQGCPRQRRGRTSGMFSSAELHRRFEHHVANAQHLFLCGDKDGAETHATLALRIHPTDHLFAFLAVVAESKGQFDRASDFRLLQAFLANDAVLWEELLHDFIHEQRFYKAAVCLQRLSSLEIKDAARYHALQLQLADLYIGLGEIKRATNVLVPLWNSSRFRDFEVFALLSSLFFQLGRWNSLHRLIETSLKSAFRPSSTAVLCGEKRSATSASMTAPTDCNTTQPAAKRSRTSKRVRFFGDPDEPEDEEQVEPPPTAVEPEPESNVDVDDFDFSAFNEGCSQATQQTHVNIHAPSTVITSLYGDVMEIRTSTAKRNFLTLVNVHAELLNEEGHFHDTVRLVEFAAGCLRVSLLELPPDLLVRHGVAYAFLGGCEQLCREVFHHLVETCPMSEYGDVLFDAANALQQVGMHADARMIFSTLRRYHEFRLGSDAGDPDERAELTTVFTAALFAEGQCDASMGETDAALDAWQRVLEVDPSHLQTRLSLGRLLEYERGETARAIALLTPREDEEPLQRIQLGAELVRVFARAGKHVEAIALGVSILELILSGEEDGDAESVAVGSSRRSAGAPLLVPTLSRASSAILPPAVIADMVHKTGHGSASSIGRLTHSLATSIRSSSVVFRMALARRGKAALTNSVYGASAAASTAAGWGGAGEEERIKDASSIFRFNRKIQSKLTTCSTSNTGKEPQDKNQIHTPQKNKDANDSDEEAERRKREREEAVTSLPAESFWQDPNPNPKSAKTRPSNDQNQEEAEGKEVETKPEEQDRVAEEYEDENMSDYADETSDPTLYTIPSLEEVSAQFTDPAMRELFVQASSNESPLPPPGFGDSNNVKGFDAQLANVASGAGHMRVTLRDALSVLGQNGFVELAVTVIDSYSAIGNFTEAKEFAFVVLSRCPRRRAFRYSGALERPLRWAVLRAALATHESEDAYRVGVRLLQEDCSEAEKSRVIELLFGVLNCVEDASAILLRLVADQNRADPPMLVLLGNRYFARRSFIRANNLYLAALRQRPNDLLITFLVGLSFLLISHQKKIRAREACVAAAWHYLTRYQQNAIAVDPRRTGEVMYNCARAFQYLGLHQLAVPLYEQVAYEYIVPDQCSRALQRAARLNLYFTYQWRTGNQALALAALGSQ